MADREEVIFRVCVLERPVDMHLCEHPNNVLFDHTRWKTANHLDEKRERGAMNFPRRKAEAEKTSFAIQLQPTCTMDSINQ